MPSSNTTGITHKGDFMKNLSIYVSLLLTIVSLSACGNLTQNTAQSTTQENAQGTTAHHSAPKELANLKGKWRVESIDQGGVIDYSMITVHINDDNRVTGLTSCNNYTGTINTENQQFLVDKVAVTRKACTPAIAMQEQRFLAALDSAATYEMGEHNFLYVKNSTGKRVLKLVPEKEIINHKPLDQASNISQYFMCDTQGKLGLRFLGPETVEISVNNNKQVLTRDITASGAKYSNDNMSFWNKGDEATLSTMNKSYPCKKMKKRSK